MSDVVGNPEDRFSHNEAHYVMYVSSTGSHGQRVVPMAKWLSPPVYSTLTNLVITMLCARSGHM